MKDVCHIKHSDHQGVRDTVREVFTPVAWGNTVSTVYSPLAKVEEKLRNHGLVDYKISKTSSDEVTITLNI
ncbi:MAG: hypothetical protein ACRBDI_09105 [Alphaproteobacteria bacterium]